MPQVPNVTNPTGADANSAANAASNIGERVPLKLAGESAASIAQNGSLGMNLNTTRNRLIVIPGKNQT